MSARHGCGGSRTQELRVPVLVVAVYRAQMGSSSGGGFTLGDDGRWAPGPCGLLLWHEVRLGVRPLGSFPDRQYL